MPAGGTATWGLASALRAMFGAQPPMEQHRFFNWKSMEQAHQHYFYDWDTIARLLGSCRRPGEDAKGQACGRAKLCTYCKLQADLEYSPATSKKQEVSQGLKAMINLQQQYRWITDNHHQTLKNLFDHYASQELPPADRKKLKNWG